MSVVLRKRKIADGRHSLYLDIHNNGKRTREYLQLYVTARPKTPLDKESNRNTYSLAENIRAKRELSINADEYDYAPAFRRDARFTDYFDNYAEAYSKKDKRKAKAAYSKFLEFAHGKVPTFK